MELGSTRFYIGTLRDGGRKNRKYMNSGDWLFTTRRNITAYLISSRKLINRKIEVTRQPVDGQLFRINKIKKLK